MNEMLFCNFNLNLQDVLQTVLRTTHDRSLNKYAAVDEEDDFQEVLDPPPIAAATQYQARLMFLWHLE